MSRERVTTRINIGPISFAPGGKAKRRLAKIAQALAVPPIAVEYDGWPNFATYGAAAMIDPQQADVMANDALGQARIGFQATEEPRRTDVAAAILAEMLHGWCEERTGLAALPPLTAHLVQVGLGEVSWDAIAREVLR